MNAASNAFIFYIQRVAAHFASTPSLLPCIALFIGIPGVTATVLASDGKRFAVTPPATKFVSY